VATKNKQQQQEPTHEQIAQRAYELSQNDGAAGEEDNWHRAERELRGEPELDGPWAKIGSGDTDSLTGD
jgi:hypothetical protein